MGTSVLGNIKGSPNSPEFDSAINLSYCTKFYAPGRLATLAQANTCVDRVQNASVNGWIQHLPLTILALQQETFSKVGDTDSAANKSIAISDMLADLKANPKEDKAPFTYICTNPAGAKTPVSPSELGKAISSLGDEKFPEGRCIPMDKASSALMGYADAQMNMDRYLDDGKTLKQTVGRILSNTTRETALNAFKLCLANYKTPEDKSECNEIGARQGLIDAEATGVRYKGSSFLGKQQSRSATAR